MLQEVSKSLEPVGYNPNIRPLFVLEQTQLLTIDQGILQ